MTTDPAQTLRKILWEYAPYPSAIAALGALVARITELEAALAEAQQKIVTLESYSRVPITPGRLRELQNHEADRDTLAAALRDIATGGFSHRDRTIARAALAATKGKPSKPLTMAVQAKEK